MSYCTAARHPGRSSCNAGMDTGESAGTGAPDQQLIVRWHGVIGHQHEARLPRQGIHRLEIADTACRVSLPQKFIEGGVAGRREAACIAERTVDTERAGPA